MGPHSLVVLTFNIWGLLHVSRRREERIAALANELTGCGADIVALQEVWVAADAQRISEAAASGGRLVHSHLFKSGFFGPGLMLLSAHPIAEAAFHPFTAVGDPSKILQGDYYGSKGIGWVRVRVPGKAHSGNSGAWRAAEQEPSHRLLGGGAGAGGAAPEHVEVDVLIIHTHANYENLRVNGHRESGGEHELPRFSVPLDADSGFRISNMVQLGQLAQSLSARPGSRVVVAGDLNNPPGSLEMALLFCLAPCLADPWMDHHPMEGGWTCDKPGNTWTKSRHSAGIRIDYVLSTMPSLRAKVVSNATANGLSLSDHEALEVELDVAASPHCHHHSGGRSRPGDVAGLACDSQQMLLAWREAGHCVSRTISGLQLRRWRMKWLAFLLVAVGISVFIWSFWGRNGYGLWEASLHRQLLATQRLEKDRGGGGTPRLAAHDSGAARRLRAFLMASSGGMMIGAGALVWVLACFGHTSQIRALEGTVASASMIY